jgi:hypothetical protein
MAGVALSYPQFVARWTGVYTPGNVQCVGLVYQWLENLGLPIKYGNAIDWAGESWPDFTWVPYRKGLFPSQGDVVVWGEGCCGIDGAGHTAICDEAAVASLLTFDEDWPFGGAPQLVTHGCDTGNAYCGVLGWQHYTVALPQSNPCAACGADEVCVDGTCEAAGVSCPAGYVLIDGECQVEQVTTGATPEPAQGTSKVGIVVGISLATVSAGALVVALLWPEQVPAFRRPYLTGSSRVGVPHE